MRGKTASGREGLDHETDMSGEARAHGTFVELTDEGNSVFRKAALGGT